LSNKIWLIKRRISTRWNGRGIRCKHLGWACTRWLWSGL